MEVEWHTATKKLKKAEIPGGAEILRIAHLRRDVPHSYCASCEEKIETSGSRGSRAWRGEVWGCQTVPGGEENGSQQEELSDPAGQVKGLYCGRRPQVGKSLPFCFSLTEQGLVPKSFSEQANGLLSGFGFVVRSQNALTLCLAFKAFIVRLVRWKVTALIKGPFENGFTV